MGLLLTPFERNIEVWRQLWRVLERSHLVVQIVDARNPLRFRCEDLEAYVNEMDTVEMQDGIRGGRRKSLLLINKADLLTLDQRSAALQLILWVISLILFRRRWADYFDQQHVGYAFFSAAAAAAALQEARKLASQNDHYEESKSVATVNKAICTD